MIINTILLIVLVGILYLEIVNSSIQKFTNTFTIIKKITKVVTGVETALVRGRFAIT